MRTFATLLSLLILSSSVSFAAEELSLPKASVKEAVFNFGAVKQGSKVEHTFLITNSGTSPLSIERIIAGCGCTAARAEGDSIPPGGTQKIAVAFDTTGFVGQKSKSVRVFTNDPENPSLVLEMKGEVRAPIQIVPRRLVFDRVVLGSPEGASEEVTVTAESEEAAKRIVVKEASPAIEVEDLGGEGLYRRFRVRVSGKEPGEIRDRISVDLPGALSAPLNLPVLAVITPPLKLSPSSLSLTIPKGRERLVRRVRVEHATGAVPFKITGIKSDNPLVKAELREDPEQRRHVIEIMIDPKEVTSDLQASIDIKTDLERGERLSLKVAAVLAPGTK